MTQEPSLNFLFTGKFLRGKAWSAADETYNVGYGSGENYIAFQYAAKIQPNNTIQATVTLYVYEACSLVIALYRDGQTSFEGKNQIFYCQGGVEVFSIQAHFLQAHTGLRIQIGCDEPRNIRFSWIDAVLNQI
jgi:hypothetical protein